MQFLLGLLFLTFSCSIVEAQLFQITKLQFSSYVSEDGNYTVVGPATDGKISRSTLKDRELFFSFTMVGLKNSEEYLRRNGRLDAFVIVYAGIQSLTKIACGITQERWRLIGKKLLDRFSEEGLFTFRTLITTEQTEHDYLTFIVRDPRGAEVGRTDISIVP